MKKTVLLFCLIFIAVLSLIGTAGCQVENGRNSSSDSILSSSSLSGSVVGGSDTSSNNSTMENGSSNTSSGVVLPSEYKVSYELNGGTLASGSPEGYVYGEGATLLNPSKKGFNFIGWYENAQFSGDAVTSVCNTAIGDKTFYAKWEIQTFTLSVPFADSNVNKGYLQVNNDTKGAEGASARLDGIPYGTSISISGDNNAKVMTLTGSATYGQGSYKATITLTPATLEGYTSSIRFATSTASSDNNVPEGLIIDGDTTLYARASRTVNKYTVTINTSGAGSVNTTSIENVPYGTVINSNENKLTINGTTVTATPNTGYAFSSFIVDGADNASGSFAMPTKNITITAVFTAINYTITKGTISNGSITISKTTAHYGDSITLSNTPNTGYKFTKYVVDGADNTSGSFTMPAKNITITAVFTAINYTITKGTISNGSITISKTTAHYGDSITLSNTPSAGYVFSSYTVDGTKQTANTFKMPAKNITVTANFTKGINGLSNANFTNNQSLSSQSGSVSINGNGFTSTKAGNSYTYTRLNGDFYYETVISAPKNNIYNNDSYPKFGIAVNDGNENFYFFVDALPNGYNGGGYGTNRNSFVMNFLGEDVTSANWAWESVTQHNSMKVFSTNYSSNAIKMGIMRVGAVYHFFVDGLYSHSQYYPNMMDTVKVGVLTFNLGCTVTNAKYGVSSSVITNAKAYYGITNSVKVTSVTVDGIANDWKENAANAIGSFDGGKYFYGAAFYSGNYVYALIQAKTSNYITNAANWYNNTNVEIRANGYIIYAAANGAKGATYGADYYADVVEDAKFNAEPEGDLYRVTIELKMKKSYFASTPKCWFAFRSEDYNAVMAGDDTGFWWNGVGTYEREITTTGLNISRTVVPTDSVIKTGLTGWADPFVLTYNNTYYMYATTSVSTGYKVSTSTDLINWSKPQYCFSISGISAANNNGLAIPAANTFANNDLWAPEVVYNSTTKKFVMFYSGKDTTGSKAWGTDLKVGVATSDSPMGPFIDANNGTPLLFPNDTTATIDGSVFVDTDGKAYLYYCRDCSTNNIANYLGDGVTRGVSQIQVTQLDSTYTRLASGATHTVLIQPKQNWEIVLGGDGQLICEGPYMYKQDGKYYLTYSCNPCWEDEYGVGLAIGYSPTGPFEKTAEPIVATDKGFTAGTGHSMMFKDTKGNLWCAFHTFSDPNWVQTDAQFWPPREALLARAYFRDGIMQVAYKNDIVTP